MKKKILFLINTLDYSGGTEKQTFQLLKNLPENKYELHLFICKYNNRIKKLKKKGIKIHLLKTLNIYNFFSYIKFFKIVKKVNPNIILTYFYKMEYFVFIMKILKILKCKWIMNERTSPLHSDSYIKRIANLLNLSDTIISNSMHGKKYWESSFKKSLLINNGYDKSNLKIKKRKSKNLRIIFLSRNVLSKNGKLFLQLVRSLDNSFLGTYVASKHNTFKKLKNLRYKKFSKNINLLYKDQDLLFFPSEFEGSPNVIYECFMRKILVLCLRRNYSELFLKKKLCLQIHSKNLNFLLKQLNQIKTELNNGKYNLMLNRAHNFAKKFSIDNQVKNYQVLFDSI